MDTDKIPFHVFYEILDDTPRTKEEIIQELEDFLIKTEQKRQSQETVEN